VGEKADVSRLTNTMTTPFRNAALLLLGHGSTLNADSSAPTYQHAEEIRRRNLFAEVHVGFWKEEPNFRQTLRQANSRQVYVVPNFISSGYFTEQVIPRELGLDGPVTHRDGRDIFYCAPVGLHPSMTEALLRRASEVVSASKESISHPAKTACLFICGHGTSMNDNSTKIIHEQAAIIRARGIYADCQAVLMEQTPFVKDWRTLTDCPDVIVVPFFISDGLHSFEDIPVLLGITHNIKEQGFTNPHQESNRRLWYATAIGTEAFIADVIIAQAEQFQAELNPSSSTSCELLPSPQAELANYFKTHPIPWQIGAVAMQPDKEGGYALFHRDDLSQNPSALRSLNSLADLRELIRLDAQGNFRPLRAAPNLRRGWLYSALNLPSLIEALDYLYPAELANWTLAQHDQLPITPWAETAERQTGRFRIVRELDETTLQDLVTNNCQSGCLKQRLWSPARQNVTGNISGIPLLCPEACNYLVGKAREKLKGPGEE
jgi:sirohydrochlorin cobaltochelatase